MATIAPQSPPSRQERRRDVTPRPAWVGRGLCAGLLLSVAQPAHAYLEGGYLKVPGVQGAATDPDRKGWMRIEAHYWKRLDRGSTLDARSAVSMGRRVFFSGPAAPAKGGDVLAVTLSRRDPALAALMAICRRGGKLSQIDFAESSDVVRPRAEMGERPAAIPEWFEYRLKDVSLGCPVVAGAPEQVVSLTFGEAEWLNYSGPTEGVPVVLKAAALPPATMTGRTRSFVVSWVGPVPDAEDKACPVMNTKPDEANFFAYMTPADRINARADLAKSGGALDYARGTVSRRGPGLLSAVRLPGMVPPDAHSFPSTEIAFGLDLDQDGGKRVKRPDVRNYRSFTAPDGRTGIDNQFYLVTACMEGVRGRKGFLDAYANEDMRNGTSSTLLSITGIDDERNDDDVDVTIFFSRDPMVKNASGKDILPDYSFRLSHDSELTSRMRRVKGRIVDGVIETMPSDNFNIGQEKGIYRSRLRLRIASDGSLKGVLGGYMPWRPYVSFYCSGQMEQLGGYRCPGVYQAFMDAADGLKNRVTGRYDGISIAYDVEARPAFIPAAEMAQYFSSTYAGK